MNTFFFSIISSLALGPIQLIVEWVVGYFQRVKCLECDSDQACPSTMKVKIEWNYIFAYHVYQHYVDREKCSRISNSSSSALKEWKSSNIWEQR